MLAYTFRDHAIPDALTSASLWLAVGVAGAPKAPIPNPAPAAPAIFVTVMPAIARDIGAACGSS